MELNYQEIGKNIRHFRKEKGMKQKELAERINMTEQHISHIENAHTQLSLPTLVAIANALEIDCNSLLGKTLESVQSLLLNQEMAMIMDSVASDTKKYRLCVEICRLVAKSDM